MLSKDQIEILTDKYITKLYDDLERETISDIARRVKKMERFTETAELQAMAMREQGYSPSKIQQQVFKILNADKAYQRQLAENTREYKQEIKKIIEETEVAAGRAGDQLVATAGDMAWNDDMQAWKKHGVDLKKPNGLQQLYAGIAKQTNGELKNITQSTGFKGTTLGTTGVLNAYRRTMDLATLKMSTGSFSYQTAVKDCIDQLAKSGLRTIDYASGRSYQLDTAARMCIRTGANQLSGKIQELNLAETDTPLVYVDAHAGPRPEHAVWQGQVYAYNPDGILRDGSKAGEKYDDFFHATDYGSVTGLMGANCAHHFYPYWEGDPIPEYEEPNPIRVGEKEYTYYEATQEMRRQERGIRETKRRIEAMNALGEDSTLLTKKLAKQEKEYRAFSNKANINPRNYVLSVKPGTTAAPKTSQSPVNSPVVNKNGKEIIFEERHTKIERVAQMRDKQKEIISNLSNEYNTRLERVTGGAFENHAAGDVSMDGTQMRLTDSHIDTAMHEFAHTLASTDGDKYGLTNDKAFWAEIRKIRTEYRKAVRKDHSLSISSYADGSDKLDEFMCEAFTQAKAKKMGIELPSAYGKDTTYSDKVLDVVDRYFAKKPLANPTYGSTIQSEMYRKIDRSRSKEGFNYISDKRFDDITAPARKNGAIIMRGSEEVEEHLDKVGANASCTGDVMLFREKVTVSEALEETRHFEQNRTGMYADEPHDVREVLLEIEAKKYILNNAKKYRIPRIEIEETEKLLEGHMKELEELRGKYNVQDSIRTFDRE